MCGIITLSQEHGEAMQGMAWHGLARPGPARLSMAREMSRKARFVFKWTSRATGGDNRAALLCITDALAL